MIKYLKSEWIILLPLIMCLFLYGGFYSFTVYLTGAFIAVLLFAQLVLSKRTIHYKREMIWSMILMCVSASISMIRAVDKGAAFHGLLRVLVFVLWMFYLMQFSADLRDRAIRFLPWLGFIMVMLGILVFLIPQMTSYLWQSERFGGLFQYANTCALFLLINILILAEEEPKRIQFLFLDVQIAGVFLTGSKGGILLLIPVLLYIFIKKRKYRKNLIVICSILLIAALIYGFIFENYQNIARIFTLIQYQSTFWGRLLYMADAIPVLITNPLGIGYMGYRYLQPTIQTGVYTSVFVHNDWIQMALDYGWIFLLIAVTGICRQLVKGKQMRYKKWIIGLICVYCLLEFHFQYLFIVMLLPLFFDYREEKKAVGKKEAVWENQIVAVLSCILFLYFGVSGLLGFMGKTEESIYMYPYDTQVLEEAISVEREKDKAVDLAKKILEQNRYVSSAYNVLSYGALMDGDYEQALAWKLQVLEIERFDMDEYADCEEMVNAILQINPSDEMLLVCENTIKEMNQLLDETKAKVSPLAYKLRDKPVFIWH